MTAATTSRIVWPRRATAGCVFCLLVRDTRGAALGHNERFNFFPASPLCCVSWVLAGEIHWIRQQEHMLQPAMAPLMPEVSFSGAQPGPVVSWNPGESFVATLCFYPDAFAALTGLDLAPFTQRVLAAAEVLPAQIMTPIHDFRETVLSDGLEAGMASLEHALEALWVAARPGGSRPAVRLMDWSRGLVARAALSAPGRSTRQIARRVKSWTGLSERSLQNLGQTEQLYANLHAARQRGEIDWADLAATSGFADQGHMIRWLRRHTGFTPGQLSEHAARDEAFWAYRLLGEYFSPAGERPPRETPTPMNGG